MEMVTSMVLCFRKLHRKLVECLGLLLLQSALPGAALLNELIVYIWSSTQRRGRIRDGGEKQEKQSSIFRRCYTSTGAYPVTIGHTWPTESKTKQIKLEGKNSFILSWTCNAGGVVLSLACRHCCASAVYISAVAHECFCGLCLTCGPKQGLKTNMIVIRNPHLDVMVCRGQRATCIHTRTCSCWAMRQHW